MSIEAVAATDTHDLRRRVLRDSRPDADVDWPEDHRPDTFHLGMRPAPGAPPVAVATFFPDPTPLRPGRRAWRLRGMAVEASLQRRGYGRGLIAAALDRLAARGAEVCWANARHSALGFYEHLGFAVCGEEFLLRSLPHHVVVLDLDDAQRRREATPPR